MTIYNPGVTPTNETIAGTRIVCFCVHGRGTKRGREDTCVYINEGCGRLKRTGRSLRTSTMKSEKGVCPRSSSNTIEGYDAFSNKGK